MDKASRAWKRAAKKWRHRALLMERDNDSQRAIASQIPYLKERIKGLEGRRMTKSVCVKWQWRCALCAEQTETYPTSEPLGWFRLSGWRAIPMVFDETDCPQEVPEWIICPKCAKVLERAMERLQLPFNVLKPNTKDYSKPISLGRIVVMA